MIKKICSLILIFILSGCTCNYTLKIDSKGVEEKVKVIEKDSSLFNHQYPNGVTVKQMFEKIKENKITGEESDYPYTMDIDITDKKLEANISNAYPSLELSSSILTCYTDYILDEENGIVEVKTESENTCFSQYDNLTQIKFVLKTNYKVLNHNADKVIANHYIWYITKDDFDVEFTYSTKEKSFNPLIILYIMGGLLIMYFMFKTFKSYIKKQNEV